MKEVLKITPDSKFEKIPPETNFDLKPVLRGQWRGSIQYFIDKISGKLATKYTPKELKKEKVLTQIHNILYWVDKNNPRGPFPINPQKSPQFYLWEKPVRDWVKKQNIKEDISIPLKEYDNIHTPENSPVIKIVSPLNNQRVNKNEKITVLIDTQNKYPLSRVDFYINDNFIGSSKSSPFSFSFILKELNNIKTINKLKIIGYDSVLNKGETSILFNVIK